MSPDSLLVLALFSGYFAVVFGIAWAAKHQRIPPTWLRHPLTYVLSLGVYTSAWAYFGAVRLARDYGYGFLAFYLGICGTFLLAPVLLLPVYRISRSYQLSSLADLFAFRYRSQMAGTLVTLVSLMAGVLLIAMQLEVIVTISQMMAPDISSTTIGIGFVAVTTLFASLFGTKRQRGGEVNVGLVATIAFDSALKLLILLLVGAYLLYTVFGGFDALDQWIAKDGHQIDTFTQHMDDGPWRTLLLMFFGAALVMPHMFHMTFTENRSADNLLKASWGLPIYLLLIGLPIPVILWAGIHLGVTAPTEYFTLGILLQLPSGVLSSLVYIGGLSAAAGLVIVASLAIANMTINHVILPLFPPSSSKDIFRWLNGVQRGLIALIITSGWGYHFYVTSDVQLSFLGVTAFTGGLQLLPGVLGALYWPDGNRLGLILGLITGLLIWFLTLAMPVLFQVDVLQLLPADAPLTWRLEDWHIYTTAALSANVAIYSLTSLLFSSSGEERSAARACAVDALSRPLRGELMATTIQEFNEALHAPLGERVAKEQLSLALHQLGLAATEQRPYPLRRLREQIEVNLSGLLGPAVASDIIKRSLPYKSEGDATDTPDIHHLERTLEDYRSRLTGLAAELDSLRRYHRQTLENLPIACCSLGEDGEILMWNRAMAALTGITADGVIGSTLPALPAPWSELLLRFTRDDNDHRHKHRILIDSRPRWYNLHKSSVTVPGSADHGLVILIEDQTETRQLEEELIHSERLASVGRLAAGVAHEIGNPITGIACLAQNLKLETIEPEVLDTAEQMLNQTKRVSLILQSLMNFSRAGQQGSSAHSPTNVWRCAQEAINLLALGDRQGRVAMHNECDKDVDMMGNEAQLVQVLINLLSNARDASSDNQDVIVSGTALGESVIIQVTDEGCGISAEDLDRIFEPFYTTKGPDKGTGLGLSLVYSIIEQHYGSIEVVSPITDDATGTRVIVTLPRARPTDNQLAVEGIRMRSTGNPR